ncbi:glycosyltransferase [Bacteroides sp. 214]|uniref:glycosyltransferase family 2 protein n=1 Tax=Bacteroides sp. 214 TaxID=2302935 RepID=UPI0013D78739|nr:glycosyltransferase [Bacteroides sp. 214]NDW13129.1 glycosyltransferase [Bacteroides sp. 214]
MSQPLLSIIVPFYGNADRHLLERCLESFKRQKIAEEKLEVLVVDGDSLGNARNRGIDQARGKYLLFIDADDYLFDNKLLLCLHSLEKQNADLLAFAHKRVCGDLHKSLHLPQPLKEDHYKIAADYSANNNFLYTAWGYIMRKDLLDRHQIRFREGVYHEDEFFTTSVFYYANYTIITDLVVYAYSKQVGSILHTIDEESRKKRIADFKTALFDVSNFLNTNAVADEVLLPYWDTRLLALHRKKAFLTIDYVVQLFRNRCTLRFIYKELCYLKRASLLPLSGKVYSWKYCIARVLSHLI